LKLIILGLVSYALIILGKGCGGGIKEYDSTDRHYSWAGDAVEIQVDK